MFRTGIWRVVAFMLVFATMQAKAQNYSFNTFAVPGASATSLWDINNHGQIVGWATFGSEESGFTSQGFLLDSRTLAMTPVTGPDGAINSSLLGISDTGVMVGVYQASTMEDPYSGEPIPVEHAFIYDGASFETFTVPGAVMTSARGISPDGRYVSGIFGGTETAGYFAYDRPTAEYVLLRDSLGIVNGMNALGVLVGNEYRFTDHSVDRVPFTYDLHTGTFAEYAGPGVRTSPRAITDDGVIAGWFVRDGTEVGFVDHGSSYEVIAPAWSSMTIIEGINNEGWLVGSATVDGVMVGLVAAPVPEPSTYALFAVALGAVVLRARRRR